MPIYSLQKTHILSNICVEYSNVSWFFSLNVYLSNDKKCVVNRNRIITIIAAPSSVKIEDYKNSNVLERLPYLEL